MMMMIVGFNPRQLKAQPMG